MTNKKNIIKSKGIYTIEKDNRIFGLYNVNEEINVLIKFPETIDAEVITNDFLNEILMNFEICIFNLYDIDKLMDFNFINWDFEGLNYMGQVKEKQYKKILNCYKENKDFIR